MPSQHSAWSPSSVSKYIACPLSYQLEKVIPSVSTIYTEEGTRAHAYVEYLVQKEILGVESEAPEHDTAIKSYAEDYVNFVKGKVLFNLKNEVTKIFVEKPVYWPLHPDCFGTADLLILSKDTLIVTDYKYGAGYKVDVVSGDNKLNAQLLTYAYYAYKMFGFLFDFKKIELIIYQPRMDNIQDVVIDLSKLNDFEKEFIEAYSRCMNGDRTAKPGSHCKWCRASSRCKALATSKIEKILEILKYGTN